MKTMAPNIYHHLCDKHYGQHFIRFYMYLYTPQTALQWNPSNQDSLKGGHLDKQDSLRCTKRHVSVHYNPRNQDTLLIRTLLGPRASRLECIHDYACTYHCTDHKFDIPAQQNNEYHYSALAKAVNALCHAIVFTIYHHKRSGQHGRENKPSHRQGNHSIYKCRL